jgi:hypothetical protein
MARARRGIDRITLDALTKRKQDADETLRKHIQMCIGCRPGILLAKTACDEGWELHKKATRANNDLTIYKGTTDDRKTGIQEGLF